MATSLLVTVPDALQRVGYALLGGLVLGGAGTLVSKQAEFVYKEEKRALVAQWPGLQYIPEILETLCELVHIAYKADNQRALTVLIILLRPMERLAITFACSNDLYAQELHRHEVTECLTRLAKVGMRIRARRERFRAGVAELQTYVNNCRHNMTLRCLR